MHVEAVIGMRNRPVFRILENIANVYLAWQTRPPTPICLNILIDLVFIEYKIVSCLKNAYYIEYAKYMYELLLSPIIGMVLCLHNFSHEPLYETYRESTGGEKEFVEF